MTTIRNPREPKPAGVVKKLLSMFASIVAHDKKRQAVKRTWSPWDADDDEDGDVKRRVF